MGHDCGSKTVFQIVALSHACVDVMDVHFLYRGYFGQITSTWKGHGIAEQQDMRSGCTHDPVLRGQRDTWCARSTNACAIHVRDTGQVASTRSVYLLQGQHAACAPHYEVSMQGPQAMLTWPGPCTMSMSTIGLFSSYFGLS